VAGRPEDGIDDAMALTLHELARRIGVDVVGDGDRTVERCAPIRTAGPADVTFLANARYRRFLEDTKAAAVLIAPGVPSPGGLTRLEAADPYFAFRNALIEFEGMRVHPRPFDADADDHAPVVSPAASVHPTAVLGAGAIVHAQATVEAGARVGARAVLYPGSYVGPDSAIGEDSVLHPNAVVYDRCAVGDRVTLHSAVVIGHDGFGYATHGGVHHKIPQTGTVVIEDDVELGAGCAIERAAMGETRIGAGTKVADLVSVGHGTRIGRHCLIVSLVGIAGSVEIGDGVVMGGQTAVAGHLRVGDGVRAAGRTGIASDVPDGAVIGGLPAVDLALSRRIMLSQQRLPGLLDRTRTLEREVAALRAALAELTSRAAGDDAQAASSAPSSASGDSQ